MQICDEKEEEVEFTNGEDGRKRKKFIGYLGAECSLHRYLKQMREEQ